MEQYLQYPLHVDDRPPALRQPVKRPYDASGFANTAATANQRAHTARHHFDSGHYGAAAQAAYASSMVQPAAAAAALSSNHNSSAHRERFLQRIRREVAQLASEQHNGVALAQRFFPHLFEQTTTSHDKQREQQPLLTEPPVPLLSVLVGNEVRSSSPAPPLVPSSGVATGTGGVAAPPSSSLLHAPVPSLAAASTTNSASATSTPSVVSHEFFPATTATAASSSATATESPPDASGANAAATVTPSSSLLTVPGSGTPAAAAVVTPAAAPSSSSSAPFTFAPSALLSLPSWQSHSIQYDALRTQMKKVVYIQSQIGAFVAEQEREEELSAIAAGGTQRAHLLHRESEEQRQQRIAAEEEASRRRDRTPKPPEGSAGAAALAPPPPLPLPPVSPLILAALRAHPSFVLLRQAHATFWALLRQDLLRVRAFVHDEAHRNRMEQLWDDMRLEQQQQQHTKSEDPAAVSGATMDTSAADADRTAKVTYMQTCPCGCGASLADAFTLVLSELAAQGVSHRALGINATPPAVAATPSPAVVDPPAAAVAAAESKPVCGVAKECAQKFFSSLLHLSALRRFLVVNGVVYSRVLDQFAHYTAAPGIDKYHLAIEREELMQQQQQQQQQQQLQQQRLAAAKAETQEDASMAVKTEGEAAVESEIPPSVPAALPILPAFPSIQAAHLAAFLACGPPGAAAPVVAPSSDSDPNNTSSSGVVQAEGPWPFTPLQRFVSALERAERLARRCFGREESPFAFENIGAEVETMLRARAGVAAGAAATAAAAISSASDVAAAVPPAAAPSTTAADLVCGLCGSACSSLRAPTLLPCCHVFCLVCLARSSSFGVACPRRHCLKDVSASDEMRVRGGHAEDLVRERQEKDLRAQQRVTNDAAAEAVAPLQAHIDQLLTSHPAPPRTLEEAAAMAAAGHTTLLLDQQQQHPNHHLTAEQMDIQRKLLHMHYQQLQRSSAAGGGTGGDGSGVEPTEVQSLVAAKLHDEIRRGGGGDGGAVPIDAESAERQEALARLYQTAALTQQKQIAQAQQKLREQQQYGSEGDIHMGHHSRPHSPSQQQAMHAHAHQQHVLHQQQQLLDEAVGVIHARGAGPARMRSRAASFSHSGGSSRQRSRSGSVVSSSELMADDVGAHHGGGHGGGGHGGGGAVGGISSHYHRRHQHLDGDDPHGEGGGCVGGDVEDFFAEIGGSHGSDGRFYPSNPALHLEHQAAQAALIAAHVPAEGDEHPISEEDLARGMFVQGCGGTLAAPLQYEEVSIVSEDGSSSSVVLKPKRGQGYSCHHCKTTKEPLALFFCSSLLSKGVNLKRCKKKYCEGCLRRLYAAEFAEGGRWWACPSCKGCCVCASCERKITGKAAPKKVKKKDRDNLRMMSLMNGMNVNQDGSGGGSFALHANAGADEYAQAHAQVQAAAAAQGHSRGQSPAMMSASTAARHAGHKRTYTDEMMLAQAQAAAAAAAAGGEEGVGVGGSGQFDTDAVQLERTSSRTPTKIRSRSNSAVGVGLGLDPGVAFDRSKVVGGMGIDKDADALTELQHQLQHNSGGAYPRTAAQVFAARHGIRGGGGGAGGGGGSGGSTSREDWSPLSLWTGHGGGHGGGGGGGGGGNSERSSPVHRSMAMKQAALIRAGSHGDLLPQHQPRSRKGSLPSSRGATPTQHAIGAAGDTNGPLSLLAHHRAASASGGPMSDAEFAHYQQAAQRLRLAQQQQQLQGASQQQAHSPRFPPMHGGNPSVHAPLSPALGPSSLSQSQSQSRRRSSTNTSPFLAGLGLGGGSSSLGSSALHSSTSSSAVVSDNSDDADATSPPPLHHPHPHHRHQHHQHPHHSHSSPHARSVSPPQHMALGSAGSNKLQEYLSMKNAGLSQHQALLQQQQQQHSNVLMSPPGVSGNVLMSPTYPSTSVAGGSLYRSGAGGVGVVSPTSGSSTTVTVAGMTAADLSQLSLGELQAMNDRIEQQLSALSGPQGQGVNGQGEGQGEGATTNDFGMNDESGGGEAPLSSSNALMSPQATLHPHLSSSRPGAGGVAPPTALAAALEAAEALPHPEALGLSELEALLHARQQKLNADFETLDAHRKAINMGAASSAAATTAGGDASGGGGGSHHARKMSDSLNLNLIRGPLASPGPGGNGLPHFSSALSPQQQHAQGGVGGGATNSVLQDYVAGMGLGLGLETPLPPLQCTSLQLGGLMGCSAPRASKLPHSSAESNSSMNGGGGGDGNGGSGRFGMSGSGMMSPLDAPLMSPTALDHMLSPSAFGHVSGGGGGGSHGHHLHALRSSSGGGIGTGFSMGGMQTPLPLPAAAAVPTALAAADLAGSSSSGGGGGGASGATNASSSGRSVQSSEDADEDDASRMVVAGSGTVGARRTMVPAAVSADKDSGGAISMSLVTPLGGTLQLDASTVLSWPVASPSANNNKAAAAAMANAPLFSPVAPSQSIAGVAAAGGSWASPAPHAPSTSGAAATEDVPAAGAGAGAAPASGSAADSTHKPMSPA